jgi:predicted RNA-binding protein with RPS1 domain
VTIPTWASTPLVHVDELGAAVGDVADIFVLPTGDLSWELTDRLPPRLDVYGGATRIWWPLGEGDANPLDHPLFFVHDRSQSDETIARIVDAFERRGILVRERVPEGAEIPAVVTRVLRNGAELRLAGGEEAFAHVSHLTSARGLAPPQIVRVGQPVRARVSGGSRAGRRVPVSLLPFEPERWDRLEEQYRDGMLVEGVVDEMRNIGAFVEIFPGIRGLLRKGQITREWVSHPEDYLALDDVIAVRITKIDRPNERIELSCLDIGDEEPIEPLAALYPDGPPWLAEPAPEVQDEDAEGLPPPERDEDVGRPAVISSEPEPAQDEPEAEEPSEVPEPEEPVAVVEAEELERVITDGRELQAQVGSLFGSAERRIRELRAEAAQVRQILEQDIAEARLRLLELAESETQDLVGSTEAALAAARREAGDLREQLAAADDDRRELFQRLKEARGTAKDADRRVARLRKDLHDERDRSDRLERELAAAGFDETARFVADVRRAWEQTTTPADRERYTWTEPVIGPEFLQSVSQVHGINRDRVVEVCAHVVSGRAPEIGGLELHPLRSSEGGGAPQREREDGAKAWRCSLQVGSPSARRLHYWQLLDGGVELAKVVYHDDFSIR